MSENAVANRYKKAGTPAPAACVQPPPFVAPTVQAAAAPAPAPASISPDEIMATLEKLGDLKAKGILTQEEFDVKKAELLKKLT